MLFSSVRVPKATNRLRLSGTHILNNGEHLTVRVIRGRGRIMRGKVNQRHVHLLAWFQIDYPGGSSPSTPSLIRDVAGDVSM